MSPTPNERPPERPARPDASERPERLVGLFVIVAMLLLVAGFGYYLYRTAERRGWLVPRAPFYTFVQSAEGLEVGDPVFLMGFEIGAISVIEAQPPGAWYNVFLGIEVRRPYYGYIWGDSNARVTTTGLLGRRRLEITKGVTGMPTVIDRNNRPHQVLVESNYVVLAEAPKGRFLPPDESASVTERAEKLLSQVEAALPNILSITNRLNVTLDSANGLLTNSAALMANLDRSTAQLPAVLSNVTVITGNLTNPAGSLGEWVITTNLNEQINILAGGLSETLNNLAAITGNLSSQVESNDQILTGVSTLVRDTDDLVQGLKQHWLLRGIFARRAKASAQPPAQQ